MCLFFFTFARFSPVPVGLSSRSRLRGTQGPRLYTTALVLGPGRAPWRVLWAFKVANLATSHGDAFRRARAEQDYRKPTCQPLLQRTTIASSFPRSYSYGHYYCVCGPLLCMCGHDVCVYALCVCSVYCVCVCTGLSLGCCVLGRTRTCKYISIFIYMPERCLHFRPLIGMTSFCSTLSFALAQLQALLGHSSSSTSTSTGKSTDPQQHHLLLECVACSSPCSMFPPT